MPLQLKATLAEHRVSQEDWARAVTQVGGRAHGKPLSPSAGAQIINSNVWPRLTPREHIKSQTEIFLRKLGVPDDRLRALWRMVGEGSRANPAAVSQPGVPYVEVEMLSPAAKKHFQIFKDPFVDDVQSSDDVFLSAEQRYIREAMYSTARHGGFLAIIGESGSGKTTLRRDLLDRIAREQLPIVAIQPRVIDKGRLTAGLICEAIVRDLSQQPLRQTLEGKARQVETILTGSSRAGNAHVLLIEEAHDLTVATLKYLKRFWELEDGFKKLLSIILIGQPEMKQMLDERMNYEAREVIRRCEIAELMPLDNNLEDYLSLKFKRIGKNHGDVDRKSVV